MGETTRIETVVLPNGVKVQIETRSAGGYQDVGAMDALSFDSVTEALEGLGECLDAAIHRMKPTKAAIEFGIEVGLQAGKLTALVCQGSTKANFAIKLEWDRSK